MEFSVEDVDTAEGYSMEYLATLDKYFADIFTEDQIISCYETATSASGSSSYVSVRENVENRCCRTRDIDDHVHQELAWIDNSTVRNSTETGRFLRSLRHTDTLRRNLYVSPYGRMTILVDSQDNDIKTSELKKEALSILKFALLSKGYKLRTTTLEQVVNKYAEQVADTVQGIYSEEINSSTLRLFFAIVCDTYAENVALRRDIDEEEEKQKIEHLQNKGTELSQADDTVMAESSPQTEATVNVAQQSDEVIETLYQQLQTIGDKKTLNKLLSSFFLRAHDLTIDRAILKEVPTWNREFLVRSLTIRGQIWKQKTKQSRQRTLLFLLGRLKKYRKMNVYLHAHSKHFDAYPVAERKHVRWKFKLDLVVYGEAKDEGYDESNTTIAINFAKSRRLQGHTSSAGWNSNPVAQGETRETMLCALARSNTKMIHPRY